MQTVYSKVRRCVEDYKMIKAGDSVAVGVSGGKDSTVALAALAGLRRILPGGFRLEAITLDMGFEGVDFSPTAELCEKLGVPYSIVKTQIAQVVFDIRKETNPCSLCAKMRRGALHEAALERGCHTVALGHHMDDAVETFMLSLFFENRLSCFSPVTYLNRKDIHLIRPLLYLTEKEIITQAQKLPVVHNPCPANGNTKRQTIKEHFEVMAEINPNIKQGVFRAMRALPLKGW